MKNENEAAHNEMELVMQTDLPIKGEVFNSLWMDAGGKFYFAQVCKHRDPEDMAFEAFQKTDLSTAVEWSLRVEQWLDENPDKACFSGSPAPLLEAAMARLNLVEAALAIKRESCTCGEI